MALHRGLALPAGLRVLPSDHRSAARVTLVAVLCVCLFILALDIAMRGHLPQGYLDRYDKLDWAATAWACVGSVREELIYRLGLMTVLVALPALWGKQAGGPWIVAAIILSQLCNVGTLALETPPWGLLRFWAVGCVWGWLYWRHGFASAAAGHGAAHVLLDPLLALALD